MAVRAINPKKIFEYTPIAEETCPVETRTVFKLQNPADKLLVALEDDAMDVISIEDKNIYKAKSGTQKRLLLINCVKGWTNMVDDEGNPVEWKNGTPEAVDESISRIPLDLRDELVAAIKGSTDTLDALRKRHTDKLKKLAEA